MSKSCVLDPLPASLFRQCSDVLLPVITRIVNLSLELGVVPTRLSAVVKQREREQQRCLLSAVNFRNSAI